tara:strand:- start:6748 stop:7353 length:606 start_codon:yes stop_codon:yes gene_type:complete
MAMKMDFSNVFKLVSALSPLLLGSILMMASIFNQNIKGIIYLAGVLLACVANIFIMNLIKSPSEPDRSITCDIIEAPFIANNYNSPAFNSMFIAFTIAYLTIPMYYNDEMNYALLVTMLVIFAVDAVTKLRGKCTTATGVLFGGLIGIIFGAGWFTLFHATGNDNLLYFNELLSNKTVCTRPNKQQFKCSVYKDGQLISQL